MRPTLTLVLMLLLSSPGLAQESGETTSPTLGQLLNEPAYFNAWRSMFGSETMPDWTTDYAETLDGPPVPSIPVTVDDQTYSLAFTCKPNECEEHQLFVLFDPAGNEAWGLLATPETGITWLGRPNGRIRSAIKSALSNQPDPS